jgi:hypothetical protein
MSPLASLKVSVNYHLEIGAPIPESEAHLLVMFKRSRRRDKVIFGGESGALAA